MSKKVADPPRPFPPSNRVLSEEPKRLSFHRRPATSWTSERDSVQARTRPQPIPPKLRAVPHQRDRRVAPARRKKLN